MARCKCCSRRHYRRCCQPLHEGQGAPTAEALMRSRYCAYALGLADYILATTHPEGPQFQHDEVAWRAQVLAFCAGTRFQGLRVVPATASAASSESTEEAWVSFYASLNQSGVDASFGERSRFLKHLGRWCYHSGERI